VVRHIEAHLHGLVMHRGRVEHEGSWLEDGGQAQISHEIESRGGRLEGGPVSFLARVHPLSLSSLIRTRLALERVLIQGAVLLERSKPSEGGVVHCVGRMDRLRVCSVFVGV
jgi:hypothetical protein